MDKYLPKRRLVQYHGHCADVLISDYGVPKNLRVDVCREIEKIWEQTHRFHDLIIQAVRGYFSDPATLPLKNYLIRNGKGQPKNQAR